MYCTIYTNIKNYLFATAESRVFLLQISVGFFYYFFYYFFLVLRIGQVLRNTILMSKRWEKPNSTGSVLKVMGLGPDTEYYRRD